MKNKCHIDPVIFLEHLHLSLLPYVTLCLSTGNVASNNLHWRQTFQIDWQHLKKLEGYKY